MSKRLRKGPPTDSDSPIVVDPAVEHSDIVDGIESTFSRPTRSGSRFSSEQVSGTASTRSGTHKRRRMRRDRDASGLNQSTITQALDFAVRPSPSEDEEEIPRAGVDVAAAGAGGVVEQDANASETRAEGQQGTGPALENDGISEYPARVELACEAAPRVLTLARALLEAAPAPGRRARSSDALTPAERDAVLRLEVASAHLISLFSRGSYDEEQEQEEEARRVSVPAAEARSRPSADSAGAASGAWSGGGTQPAEVAVSQAGPRRGGGSGGVGERVITVDESSEELIPSSIELSGVSTVESRPTAAQHSQGFGRNGLRHELDGSPAPHLPAESVAVEYHGGARADEAAAAAAAAEAGIVRGEGGDATAAPSTPPRHAGAADVSERTRPYLSPHIPKESASAGAGGSAGSVRPTQGALRLQYLLNAAGDSPQTSTYNSSQEEEAAVDVFASSVDDGDDGDDVLIVREQHATAASAPRGPPGLQAGAAGGPFQGLLTRVSYPGSGAAGAGSSSRAAEGAGGGAGSQHPSFEEMTATQADIYRQASPMRKRSNLARLPFGHLSEQSGLYVAGEADPDLVSRPWFGQAVDLNMKKFGNSDFRPMQAGIIDAVMSGRDVFVLVPTGGGKSLTYQLPALLSPGVTLVVSPLISLIQDQVDSLLNNDIEAVSLSSTQTVQEQNDIFQRLTLNPPDFHLLYVTPEKLVASDRFTSALRHLYDRGLLTRIAIDEAHCVSQWGHDFRPDYKRLGMLRSAYPGTPFLALTATATPSVCEDVIRGLRIQGCALFRASLNRENLRYAVIPKQGKDKTVEVMARIIKSKYPKQSGIVYCFSKKDCEYVASALRRVHRVKARHYHAGLNAKDRTAVQRDWSNDSIQVVVATIAFGMGVDKPDVRFVFHHAMPKSLEGYYQESGRAGRDGHKAQCTLFYSWADKTRYETMFASGRGDRERHREMLGHMLEYCESSTRCRRKLVLEYLGETASSVGGGAAEEEAAESGGGGHGIRCNSSCDNCKNMARCGGKVTRVDLTEKAVSFLRMAAGSGAQSYGTLVDAFRGSRTKNAQRLSGMTSFGHGKSMPKAQVERLLRRLILNRFAVEQVKQNGSGWAYVVLEVDETRLSRLEAGGDRVVLESIDSGRSRRLELPGQRARAPRTQPSPQDARLAAALRARLEELRAKLAVDHSVTSAHVIINASELEDLSTKRPLNGQQFCAVLHHWSEPKFMKFGHAFIREIRDFMTEQGQAIPADEGGSIYAFFPHLPQPIYASYGASYALPSQQAQAPPPGPAAAERPQLPAMWSLAAQWQQRRAKLPMPPPPAAGSVGALPQAVTYAAAVGQFGSGRRLGGGGAGSDPRGGDGGGGAAGGEPLGLAAAGSGGARQRLLFHDLTSAAATPDNHSSSSSGGGGVQFTRYSAGVEGVREQHDLGASSSPPRRKRAAWKFRETSNLRILKKG